MMPCDRLDFVPLAIQHGLKFPNRAMVVLAELALSEVSP